MSDRTINAEQFNAEHPIGTPVRYWPGARVGAGRNTVTRSAAWTLRSGDAVVMVADYSGGISLTHIEISPEGVADEPGVPSLEVVLGQHLECGMGASPESSADTGRDVWSCGISAPFRETMDAAHALHLAEVARQWALRDDVVAPAAAATLPPSHRYDAALHTAEERARAAFEALSWTEAAADA